MLPEKRPQTLVYSILGWGVFLVANLWAASYSLKGHLLFTGITTCLTLLYFSTLLSLSPAERKRGFIRRSLALLPGLPLYYAIIPYCETYSLQLSGAALGMGMLLINLHQLPGLKQYTNLITPPLDDATLRRWIGNQIALECHKRNRPIFDIRFTMTDGGDGLNMEGPDKKLTDDQIAIVTNIHTKLLTQAHGYQWPSQWWDTYLGAEAIDSLNHQIALTQDETLGLIRTPTLSAHELMELYT